MNPCSRSRADGVAVAFCDGGDGEKIALIQGDHVGELALLEEGDQGVVQLAQSSGGIHYQHRDVDGSQHLTGLLNSQLTQHPLVVQTGGVDDDHGSQGKQLHGLLHGIGGGARHVRDYRQGLTRDGVDQGGLARVAQAEEADVDAVGGGGLVEVVHG